MNKLPTYAFFGLLLACLVVGVIILHEKKGTPDVLPTVSPTQVPSTTLRASPSQTAFPSLTPSASPGGATYYKTETKCQNNVDCYICPPQPAGSTQTRCIQGECIKGYCYWRWATDQCQKGYVKVCEAGMCECLKQ